LTRRWNQSTSIEAERENNRFQATIAATRNEAEEME